MLYAGRHGAGSGEIVALIAFYRGHTHCRSEHGVFAVAFGYTSPACVAGYVDHGRECPADTGRRCFAGSYGRTFLYQGRVPCGALSERNREYGAESVYYIACEHQRNSKAGIFYGIALKGIYGFRIDFVENRTHHAGLYPARHVG